MQQAIARWGVLLLLAGTLTYLFFAPLLREAPGQVLDPWSEGYKAYSVMQYHILHDTSFAHFGGMNYPYGEHVIPAGTQPLVSNLLKHMSPDLPQNGAEVFGLVHRLMALGFFLSIIFLYLLQRKLGLPFGYGLATAVGISLLSPILLRIPVHYGLAHPEVIPLILLLMLRYEERPDWKQALWLALPVGLYAGIHFYFLAILGALIGLYFLLRWWSDRTLPHAQTITWHFVLAWGVPALLWFGWFSLTDTPGDRTALPWGFFEYRARPAGLFLAPDLPHFRWLSSAVLSKLEVGLEARNYLGLAGIAGLLLFLFKRLDRRNPEPVPQVADRFLRRLMTTGMLLLIFALGIPFIIPALEPGIRWLGPLGQFRSIGRFAWIMFYAVNLYVCYEAWQVRKNKPRSLLPRGVALLLVVEGCLFLQQPYLREGLQLKTVEYWTEGQHLPAQLPFDPAAYQAVIPIPYYNIGSDQFWLPVHGRIGRQSMTYSVQTGTPLTAAMLTRTAFSETINQLQLISEPYRQYRLLRDLTDDRSFLIMVDEQAAPELLNEYEHLFGNARLLYRSSDAFAYYELSLTELGARPARTATHARQQIESLRDSFAVGAELMASDSLPVVYHSFDQTGPSAAYLGSGGRSVDATSRILLWEDVVAYPSEQELLLSVWFYIGEDLLSRTSLHLREADPHTNATRQTVKTHVFDRVKTIDTNGWVLIEIPIQLREKRARLGLEVRNQMYGGELLFDELLLRSVGVHVYRYLPDGLWLDNRLYPDPTTN